MNSVSPALIALRIFGWIWTEAWPEIASKWLSRRDLVQHRIKLITGASLLTKILSDFLLGLYLLHTYKREKMDGNHNNLNFIFKTNICLLIFQNSNSNPLLLKILEKTYYRCFRCCAGVLQFSEISGMLRGDVSAFLSFWNAAQTCICGVLNKTSATKDWNAIDNWD